MFVFVIYDSKAEAYMQPWYKSASGAAVRDFMDFVNDPKTPFFSHPEDYILFEIGAYDERKAVFENLPHRSLGVGIDFKKVDNG